MDTLELLRNWWQEHSAEAALIKYLIWVILILVLVQFMRKMLRKTFTDLNLRYKSQKGIEVIGYIFLILLTVSYFTGNIKDFALAVGLFTAGITITLQELILSIAGSVYIFFVKVYKPGDRIEINGIKGDVIDIDSIYTTMMEIGEWVSSDNYSGRIVKLSNAFVFRGPVYNYSRDFPFIWDEFNLPVRYGSDIELAKNIVITTAEEVLSAYVEESKSEWASVVKKYYIEDAQVNPTLAISLTDNWINFNLRYIVDYRKRRSIQHRLNEQIHQSFKAAGSKIILASSTVEIVRLPEINLHPQKA